MHILIAAMPFSGHVLPLLGVAHALVNRGHSVTFYTGAAFQTHVKSAGGTWLPFNHAPDFDQKDPDPALPRCVQVMVCWQC
ncbi:MULTISPECIES: glycosyltransferase [unclassified Kocuria]|uniref:glycosyltransferase n=1 Tax=unclassified Kocuria TaxID=2649579 RepID=UPI001439FE08|nr:MULTISPECIES: glycosyltransferase family 1 protein [unclassified Kocuria]